MCEKCKEIDIKIEHYRRLAERVPDPCLPKGSPS
jgi:hypothetical protein